MTEPAKWRLQDVNHINAITDGWEDTIEHFRDRVGFTLDRRIPDEGHGDGTDAVLMSLGGVMFEFFAPKQRTERGQGRLLAMHGDHYIGIEYKVPDVAEARLWSQQHEVRIIRDEPELIFTYPKSSFGVSFELWSGDFSDYDQQAGYWQDAHPLGLMGPARMSVAVDSVEAAAARLEELAEVTKIEDVVRKPGAARGVSYQVGEIVWEILEPTGEGPVAEYIARYGERIRSVVFRTKQLAQVEKHLTAQGLDLISGDAEGTIAINPAQNKNLMMEFTE